MSILQQPVVRIHLWLETETGVYFGQGRLQLLEKIQECGSLQAAAKALGMSYRGAWGKIKATEQIIGFKLLEKGAGNRAGFHLSEFALILMDHYQQWLAGVEAEALRLARELFPCDPKSYEDRPQGRRSGSPGVVPASRRERVTDQVERRVLHT